jgi:hypothetical protein
MQSLSQPRRYWPGKVPDYARSSIEESRTEKETELDSSHKTRHLSERGLDAAPIDSSSSIRTSRRREVFEGEVLVKAQEEETRGTLSSTKGDIPNVSSVLPRVNEGNFVKSPNEQQPTIRSSRHLRREIIEESSGRLVVEGTTDREETPTDRRRRPIEEPVVVSYGMGPEENQLHESESGSRAFDYDEAANEEEEQEDEEQEDTKVLLKPIFIPKGRRETQQEKERQEREDQVMEQQKSLAKDTRRQETQQWLVDDKRRSGEDGQRITNGVDNRALFEEIDDSDEANPQEEYAAWKIRELQRLKRDYEEMLRSEKEREDIERYRQMNAEERRQEEELKHRADQKARQERGKMGLLQKWYHKGAFYQDVHTDLISRDYNAPTGDDRIDKSLLPRIMQVKDFGKRGRSKWTHLAEEDTSRPTIDESHSISFPTTDVRNPSTREQHPYRPPTSTTSHTRKIESKYGSEHAFERPSSKRPRSSHV